MSRFSSELSCEKPSSFSQTCSLLSRYLKENKGAIGDLSLGMSYQNNDMSMVAATPITETSNISTMDLFPQNSGFGSSVSEDDQVAKISYKVDQSVNKPEPESSQMTVFYGGQAFVFNDISSDKATEITTFASKATYQVPRTFSSAPIQRPIESHSAIRLNNVNNMSVDRLSPSLAIDIPIARKASLTRFFEKRKDRTSTRAPYQMKYSKTFSTKEYQKSWLGLSPQSYPEHFEFQS